MRSASRQTIGFLMLVAALALAVPAAAQPAPPAPSQPAPPAPGQQTPPPSQPAPSPPMPPIPALPPVSGGAPGQPLTLGDAVTKALQQNYSIRQAALAVLLARAQLNQAEAGPWPTVSVQGSYTSTSAPGGGTLAGTISIAGAPSQSFVAQVPSQITPPWAFKLALTYPLYTGNALQDQIAITQANVRVAEAAFVVTAQQTVLSVRQAYYNVQLAQGVVAADQRAVAAAQENARVTDARVRAGTSPRFDLLQAQVLLAQSQLALTNAKASLVQAQQSLAALLVVPLDTTVAPATPLGLTPPSADLDSFIQQALRTRPELVEVRASEDAARASIDLAASGLRPNVSISGGPGIQTTDPTANNPVVWSGTILMTIAIFDGGLTKAKIDAARQVLAQDTVTEEQTRQSVELDVRNAYIGLQAAVENLRSAQAALDSAREALRIATLRYQAGVGTQLEVVTAEQNLASADAAVVQALFAYNLASAQMDRAVGIQVTF